MNEKISDERLRTLIEKCNSFNWQAPKEHCSYGVGIGELEAMAAELLSLRSLNKRLVEDSRHLAQHLYYQGDLISRCMDTGWTAPELKQMDYENHTALMKKIGG